MGSGLNCNECGTLGGHTTMCSQYNVLLYCSECMAGPGWHYVGCSKLGNWQGGTSIASFALYSREDRQAIALERIAAALEEMNTVKREAKSKKRKVTP